jgi:hypothetical protein
MATGVGKLIRTKCRAAALSEQSGSEEEPERKPKTSLIARLDEQVTYGRWPVLMTSGIRELIPETFSDVTILTKDSHRTCSAIGIC